MLPFCVLTNALRGNQLEEVGVVASSECDEVMRSMRLVMGSFSPPCSVCRAPALLSAPLLMAGWRGEKRES